MRFHGGINTEQYLDFSVNVPAKELGPKATAYLQQALQKLHLYPSIYAEKQTSRLEAQLGTSVVLGNGATQLIHAIGRMHRRKQILIVEPTFTEYAGALKASTLRRLSCLGLTCLNSEHQMSSEKSNPMSCQDENLVRATEQKRLTKAIAETANGSSCSLIVLCNPNNPTGGWISLDGIREILASTQATLFVDESFVDFVDEIDLAEHQKGIAALISQYPNRLIVLRSLTKSFSVPGLRIGYALGSTEIVSQIRDEIEPWSLNTFALAFLDYILDEHLLFHTQCNHFSEERNYLQRELESFGLKVLPSCTNFLLFQAHRGLNSSLNVRGINIRVCADFPFLDETYYRVTVRKREENKVLIEAIQTEIQIHQNTEIL